MIEDSYSVFEIGQSIVLLFDCHGICQSVGEGINETKIMKKILWKLVIEKY